MTSDRLSDVEDKIQTFNDRVIKMHKGDNRKKDTNIHIQQSEIFRQAYLLRNILFSEVLGIK